MKCRKCGEKIGEKLWNGWELCDKCGHRHHVKSGWFDEIINEDIWKPDNTPVLEKLKNGINNIRRTK